MVFRNLMLSLITAYTLAACQSIGPTAVRAGMPEYNAAILETGDEVMMLNFVRIRYRPHCRSRRYARVQCRDSRDGR
jgi:hypothetical protein